MIQIEIFTFNLFAENTYVVWDEHSKEAAVIDPGNSDEGEDMVLEKFISENNLEIKYLINTHCHIDHILGCKFVKEKYNPEYFAPEKDMPLLENANKQAEIFNIDFFDTKKPDKFIKKDTILSLGLSKMNFIFTPGHTPGEYCIYFEKEKICITGDVLFKEGVGRTDLWGGNYNQLINSIETKLFLLPDDVIIYPGHGSKSSIGEEKQHNPFLV